MPGLMFLFRAAIARLSFYLQIKNSPINSAKLNHIKICFLFFTFLSLGRQDDIYSYRILMYKD